MSDFATYQSMNRIHKTISPNLDQVVQRIDTPSTAVPVPVPFPGHIYQTVMFLMPEIRSIPFQHTGFMELQEVNRSASRAA